MADPHRTPPQEIRVETWIELVGMLATALRAGLLNSPQSVAHSGACDELNLLINARMGVGHAGVAMKRSSCRQGTVWRSFRLTDSFPQNTSPRTKRCCGGLVHYRIFSTPAGLATRPDASPAFGERGPVPLGKSAGLISRRSVCWQRWWLFFYGSPSRSLACRCTGAHITTSVVFRLT